MLSHQTLSGGSHVLAIINNRFIIISHAHYILFLGTPFCEKSKFEIAFDSRCAMDEISTIEFACDFSELHDAVFVVGALDETVMLRGMRYHPIDIENSVMRCHKKIAEW